MGPRHAARASWNSEIDGHPSAGQPHMPLGPSLSFHPGYDEQRSHSPSTPCLVLQPPGFNPVMT
eukprot:5320010-Prymnesium_polylepis.1